MCSSKEPASSIETPVVPPLSQMLPRRISRRLLLFMTIAVVVTITAFFVFVPGSPEPWLAEARHELAGVSEQIGVSLRRRRIERAREFLQRYRLSRGREPEAAALLWGAIHSTRGARAERASAWTGLALDRVPTSDLLVAVSLCFGGQDFQGADAVLDEAVHRTDARESVLRLAIVVRYELGRDDDVLAYSRELTQLQPADARPWLMMAFVHEKQGKLNQVIEPLRRVIKLAPEGADTYRLKLVDYLLRVRLVRDARIEFDHLQANHSVLLPPGTLLEARLLYLEGHPNDALALIERWQADHPNDLAALLLEGEIRVALQQYEEAITALARVVAVEPAEQEAHHHLGQAYARRGDQARAKEHLDRHHWLVRAKTEVYRLQRLAGQRPRDIALRKQIVVLCEEIGWPEMAAQWKRAAEIAADNPSLKESPVAPLHIGPDPETAPGVK
jgi:tetratricopeptide (TPR) repeat protein